MRTRVNGPMGKKVNPRRFRVKERERMPTLIEGEKGNTGLHLAIEIKDFSDLAPQHGMWSFCLKKG